MAANQMLAQVDFACEGETTIASVAGEIDLSNAEHVEDTLDSGRLAAKARALILDLTALEYLDSSGVRLLFRLAERVRAGGRELRVVVPRDGYLRRVLAVAGLDQTIPLDGTVDQALTKLF